jgi:hypothetical protein
MFYAIKMNNNIKGPPLNPSLILDLDRPILLKFLQEVYLFFDLVYCAILGSQLYKKWERKKEKENLRKTMARKLRATEAEAREKKREHIPM